MLDDDEQLKQKDRPIENACETEEIIWNHHSMDFDGLRFYGKQ